MQRLFIISSIVIGLMLLTTSCKRNEVTSLIRHVDYNDLTFALKFVSKNDLKRRLGDELHDRDNYNDLYLFDFRIQSNSGSIKKMLLDAKIKLNGTETGLLPFYLREEFKNSFLLKYDGRTLTCNNIHAINQVLDSNSITYSLMFYDKNFNVRNKVFESDLEVEFKNDIVIPEVLTFIFEAEQLNRA